ERRREIGILKAIGASNARVIFQFMAEALTLTLAGALVGIIIGVIGGNPVTNMLVTSSSAPTVSASTPSGGFGQRFRDGGGGGFTARPITGNVFQRGGNGIVNSAR